MMSRKLLRYILIFIALFVFALSTTWATPFPVTLDISSLAGLDIELELDLFDTDGILGNSYVWMRDTGKKDARDKPFSDDTLDPNRHS